MHRLLLLTVILAVLAFSSACDKSENTREPQPQPPEKDENIASKEQTRAALPRIMPSIGRKVAKQGPRGAYQELKSSNPTEISFLQGVTEIPADQCAQMYIKDMKNFSREEVAVKSTEGSKIKNVTNVYHNEIVKDKKIQADTTCLPMAGSMAKCKDPNEKCIEEKQMSEFFLGLFISDNEGEMIQDVKSRGFTNKLYACMPREPGQKPYKLNAWYTNDYKGNGLAIAAVRRPDGWFVSNCRSEKAGEIGLMSCLCSTLPGKPALQSE